MMNWLRRFWYTPTVDAMQAEMLKTITSNRPSLEQWRFPKEANPDMRINSNFERDNLRARNTSRDWYDRGFAE